MGRERRAWRTKRSEGGWDEEVSDLTDEESAAWEADEREAVLIQDSVSQNSENGSKNETEQLKVAGVDRPVCICKFGFVGRGCKDRHPKHCKVFKAWGSSGEKYFPILFFNTRPKEVEGAEEDEGAGESIVEALRNME